MPSNFAKTRSFCEKNRLKTRKNDEILLKFRKKYSIMYGYDAIKRADVRRKTGREKKGYDGK